MCYCTNVLGQSTTTKERQRCATPFRSTRPKSNRPARPSSAPPVTTPCSPAGASSSKVPAIFTVDPRSGVPLYLQLMEQVKRAVALGTLAGGEQLPTVKSLALGLTI